MGVGDKEAWRSSLGLGDFKVGVNDLLEGADDVCFFARFCASVLMLLPLLFGTDSVSLGFPGGDGLHDIGEADPVGDNEDKLSGGDNGLGLVDRWDKSKAPQ